MFRDGAEAHNLSGFLDRPANIRAFATDGLRYVGNRLVSNDLSSSGALTQRANASSAPDTLAGMARPTLDQELRLGGYALPTDHTLIMGVLNVTPDSFSDGGLHLAPVDAIAHARKLVDEGADLIDVGGESTRPGAATVSTDDELARVLPVISTLAPTLGVPISIDTRNATVAATCLAAGAAMVNDISGLANSAMLHVIADTGAASLAAAPVA